MKIFKWVPISNSEQKKKIPVSKGENKENNQKVDSLHPPPNFGLIADDSNTCKQP